MAGVAQQFAVRGSEGLFAYDDLSQSPKQLFFQPRTNSIGCRLMTFSPCGKYLAYCDGEKTAVLDTNTWQPLLTRPDLPSTTYLYFSPKSTFLCTWHPFKIVMKQTTQAASGENSQSTTNPAPAAPNSKPNLVIFSMKTMEIAAEYVEKNHRRWHPLWSEDESIFGRLVGSELLFHQNNDFGKYANKLVAAKLNDFSVAPSNAPYHIAAYVPPGNQPATVRVYRYPEFQAPVANKTFFKADSVNLNWNKRGNALIVMALTEVDSTGKSYYGETNLYLVMTNGDSFLLPLGKPGPIYSVDWHPNSSEFCVVYGFMPAKATLYNLKGEPLFDFGTGPRNEVHYNPQGDILCICGFGNLRGNVELWSSPGRAARGKRELVRSSQFTAEDTTLFRWAPNGRHFATATTAPRLRVNNGYKLWTLAGDVIFEHKSPKEQEMWEVAWKPVPVSEFPNEPPDFGAAANGSDAKAGVQQQKPQAYVPPHLRGKTNQSSFKVEEDYELPSNLKEKGQDAATSKQALKNRKKREAAKNRQTKDDGESATAKPGGTSTPADATDPETELQKKRKITKKLEAIAALKEKLKAGEKLQGNQLDKIAKEAELLKELQDLTV